MCSLYRNVLQITQRILPTRLEIEDDRTCVFVCDLCVCVHVCVLWVCVGVGVGNFTLIQDRKVLRERIHVASLGMYAVLGTLSCFHIGFRV